MSGSEPMWPKKTREYEDMDADSRRWNDFKFRDGDIVIDTLGKSGTTLMQQIVGQLIFEGEDGLFGNPVSPSQWLDLRLEPLQDVMALLEAQTHRRCIKTHLPIDALVFSPNAKYIYVGRDMRDIIWSWYNVIAVFTKEPANPPSLPLLSRVGVREFYLGVADYEPMWKHVGNWWAFRHHIPRRSRVKIIGIIANVLFPGLGTLLVGKLSLGAVQLLLSLVSLILLATGLGLVPAVALAIAVLVWSLISVTERGASEPLRS